MLVALDCETTGLSVHHGDRPFAFSFCREDGETKYIRFHVNPLTREVGYRNWDFDDGDRAYLARVLSDQETVWIFHNASFDIPMIKAATGIDLSERPFFDTLILAHLANNDRATYKLKPLAKAMLNFPDEDETELHKATNKARREGKKLGWKLADSPKADFWMAPPELCEKYAVCDAQRTIGLFKAFQPLLEATEAPYKDFKALVDMEHQVLRTAIRMNARGVRIDLAKTAELRGYYEGLVAKGNEEKAALGYPDLNPASPLQMKKVFYEDLGFDPETRRRKKKDGTSEKTETLDKKVLDKLSSRSPLAKCLLEMSEASHQLESFITPFQEESVDGILYPNFNSVGPRTGRFSCSGPNLQNITSESSPFRKSSVLFRARECFVPRDGCAWLLADYEQIEIWVAAYLSKDPAMLEALESGNSVHDLTCDSVFGHKLDFKENRKTYRKLAKIITFSILYGSGPKALAELLGITYDEAKDYYNRFWDLYRGLRGYSDRLAKAIKQAGYITDIFGRPYFLDPKFGYKALNYMVQGTAAGILKRAMLNVDNWLKGSTEAYPIMTIHDEQILECHKSWFSKERIAEVVKQMQGNFHAKLGMPKPFKIGVSLTTGNWNSKFGYDEI